MTSAETSFASAATNRERHRAFYSLLISALLAQLVLLGFSMLLAELAPDGWFFNIDNLNHVY